MLWSTFQTFTRNRGWPCRSSGRLKLRAFPSRYAVIASLAAFRWIVAAPPAPLEEALRSSRSTARLVGLGRTTAATPRSVAARPTHPQSVWKTASCIAAPSLFVLDHLDLEVDVHVVAHDQPAGVEGLAPLHPEVLPVDLAVSRESGPRVPHRVLRHQAVEGPGQDDLLGHAQQGQVALRHILIVADFFEGLHLVRHRRIFLDVKEVRAAEVSVPLDVIAVERGRLDRGFDGLDGLGVRVHLDEAGVVFEPAGGL